MVDGPLPVGTIPASVPDAAVPAEKVETQTVIRQKTRRASRFLKGPIPLSWIRRNVRAPADRLLLVLVAHSDMRQSTELRVTADILRDAGIGGRKAAYRALGALEANGSLILRRHRGRRSVVQLTAKPARKKGVI
jgi:hypothetical protein